MREITIADAARRSKLTPSYIARACRTGELPARKFGAAWTFTQEDFDLWNAARQSPGNPNWKGDSNGHR